jgi:hypothetical protein
MGNVWRRLRASANSVASSARLMPIQRVFFTPILTQIQLHILFHHLLCKTLWVMCIICIMLCFFLKPTKQGCHNASCSAAQCLFKYVLWAEGKIKVRQVYQSLCVWYSHMKFKAYVPSNSIVLKYLMSIHSSLHVSGTFTYACTDINNDVCTIEMIQQWHVSVIWHIRIQYRFNAKAVIGLILLQIADSVWC